MMSRFRHITYGSDFVKETASEAERAWCPAQRRLSEPASICSSGKSGLPLGEKILRIPSFFASESFLNPSLGRASEAERERNFLAGEIDNVFSYKVRADSGVADMYWTSTDACNFSIYI